MVGDAIAVAAAAIPVSKLPKDCTVETLSFIAVDLEKTVKSFSTISRAKSLGGICVLTIHSDANSGVRQYTAVKVSTHSCHLLGLEITNRR